MPRNGETETAATPDVHRVQNHEVTKPSLGPLGRWPVRANPEQPAIIPLPVFMLSQHNGGMLELHTAKVETAIHEIARVVAERHFARGDEQRILVVAELQRIDRHAGEKASTDPADVYLAVDRRLHPGLDRSPHRRLPVVGLRGEQRDAHHDHAERDEHAQADEGDEVAASHVARRRLRNPGRSKR